MSFFQGKFTLSNIKGDLSGGLTAGIVTLPVALAYGQATELGAIAGIYSAIVLGLIAAIFGGTRTQISCPTGLVLVVVIVVIQTEMKQVGNDLEKALPMILLTFLVTGIFQLLFGAFRLGRYMNYIPYPVISGFMTGVGIIIVLLQVNDVMGVYDQKYTLNDTVTKFPHLVANLQGRDLLYAGGTVLIILGLPKLVKSLPSTLVAILFMSGIAFFLESDMTMVPSLHPDFQELQIVHLLELNLDDWHSYVDPIVFGLTIAIVASINSLLSSVVADNMTDDHHSPDKELIGQGAGNFLASIFGAIPGGGATACTVANINAGGRTRLSGIIAVVFLIIVFLFGGDLIALIPRPVLGGVLVTVGLAMVDKKALRQFRNVPKMDNVIMITVVIFTVYNELMYAVIIGLALASIHFMKRMADMVELDSKNAKVDRLIDQLIDTFEDPVGFRKSVVVKNIKGPIFFGFASRFIRSIENIGDFKAIVFNLGGVPYMDQSGLYTMEKTVNQLCKKGILVCLSEVNEKNEKLLRSLEVIPQLVQEHHVFGSVEEGVMWLNEPGNLDGTRDPNDLYIPSAYTPNGDGINDEWGLKNIDRYPNCVVRIFNAEGKQVFESVGYRDKWEGVKDGELLPAGTYFYDIDLHGDGAEVLKGKVTMFT